jgi:hypothetical protein
MTHRFLSSCFATAVAFAVPAAAQDSVTLHSVTVHANNDVTVVYSKNFATCAHLRFSNAACTQYGALTHAQNIFCTQGTMVTVTRPATSFVGGFGPGSRVFLVHGNNSSVRSACVDVGCDGVYGAGCAGAAGVPVLAAVDACPPAGGNLDLTVTNAAPGSLGVLGFGLGQTSFPLLSCTLLVSNVLGTVVVPLDAGGAGGFTLPIPAGSNGFTFTSQAFVLDVGGPEGFSATNGMLVRVL